jgi:two-component sensor histidine kinase/PAS domain-containing protein
LPSNSPKQLISFALIAIAVLVGVWCWLAVRTHKQAENDAVAAAATSTRLAQENFLWTIRSVDLVLEMTQFAAATPAQIGSDAEAQKELHRLAARLPYIGSLSVIDDEGRLKYATNATPASLGQSFADRPYFQAHLAGVTSFVSPRTRGRITGNDFFGISRRLERDGKFAGVVLAAFDPAYFPGFGRSLGLGDNGEIAIVSGKGELVVSTGERSLAALPTLWRAWQEAARPNNEGFDSQRWQTSDGVDYLVAGRPISGYGLVTLYVAPWSDLMSNWQHRFWIGTAIIALAVTVIGGGAGLATVFGRRQADLRNIVGLRTAEATRSNERLELAVEATGIGIFDYDTRRRSLAWSGVGPPHFGLPPVESLTPSRFMRHVHPADRLTLVRELRRLRSGQSDGAAIEFRMRHPDAGQIWVAARGRMFGNGSHGGVAHRIIGTIRDITEQRLLQEHKDSVLREINHRIKNSLQLMNSIMNLQSRRIASAEERGRFEVARRRLVALATVYAHLDDTARPDSVELIAFLRRLCRDFAVAYMSDGRSALTFAGQGEVIVPTTQAVPLGMAVGEILVNLSLQLSENNARGVVRVEAKANSTAVEVRVIDNDRIGINAFAGAAGPLSYTLIHAFVDQIGGQLAISDEDGGTWLITFQPSNSNGAGRPANGGHSPLTLHRA